MFKLEEAYSHNKYTLALALLHLVYIPYTSLKVWSQVVFTCVPICSLNTVPNSKAVKKA